MGMGGGGKQILRCVLLDTAKPWDEKLQPIEPTRSNCFLYWHFTLNGLVQITWRAVSPSGRDHF